MTFETALHLRRDDRDDGTALAARPLQLKLDCICADSMNIVEPNALKRPSTRAEDPCTRSRNPLTPALDVAKG